ncbi:OmpA family protein [Vibrio parahaemolyticus]|nr:OmpA family protein [Vibrio parahaemolyticus]EJC6729031.1 OmpA family protein [Vibrio parahaemolyticus]EJC6942937.1 OmpA family protein [Vibrio parahaemolyticus]EJC7031026.1 OmpA family protein [Vibrio parahaemolyticus]EJC7068027.1 OmpA family protein [Vibrio parahaemolyticus]
MKKLISFAIIFTSNVALANCINHSENYVTSKVLKSSDTKITQVDGKLSSVINEDLSIVQDEKIEKVEATNATESCTFDKNSMSLVLHYDTNEHYLTNVHKQAISKYLELVNEDKRILVEGHTDDVGSQAYNKSLSLRRASTASKYLKKDLELGNRIVEKAFGESAPICKVNENKLSGCNRRVVLTIE